MVRIDGGKYMMGDSFDFQNDDALPVHEVDIKTFYLARTETTFDAYDEFVRRTGSRLPLPNDGFRGRRAVSDVSWDEADAFCRYVGARLPTEREWEYAAAGGARKQLYAGTNDEADVDAYVSYRENSNGETHVVGMKQPNLFGLYDMSGNVSEWVSDYYEKYPRPGEEPIYNDPDERDMRITRGGGVHSELTVARTYWRAGTLRGVRAPQIGFRCAMDRQR